mgnify:CR=1 FL=1
MRNRLLLCRGRFGDFQLLHGVAVVQTQTKSAEDIGNGITQAEPFQRVMEREGELHPQDPQTADADHVDRRGDAGALHASQAAQKDLRDRIRDIAPAGNEQPDLAGGDHLHFGVLVGGLPVQPLEWLDSSWVKNNILSRLNTNVK